MTGYSLAAEASSLKTSSGRRFRQNIAGPLPSSPSSSTFNHAAQAHHAQRWRRHLVLPIVEAHHTKHCNSFMRSTFYTSHRKLSRPTITGRTMAHHAGMALQFVQPVRILHIVQGTIAPFAMPPLLTRRGRRHFNSYNRCRKKNREKTTLASRSRHYTQ